LYRRLISKQNILNIQNAKSFVSVFKIDILNTTKVILNLGGSNMENRAKKEDIDSMLIKSGKHFITERVVGKPVILEEVILIPVISVMVGYGIGGEKYNRFKGMKGVDIGGCIGVIASIDAILIIRDSETSIIQIREINNLDDILSRIPDRVGKFNVNKENVKEEMDFNS